MNKPILTLAMPALLAAATASAQLYVYEGFDYTSGTSLSASGDGGFGWSAAWVQNTAGNDLTVEANATSNPANQVQTGLRVAKLGGGPGTGTLYSRTLSALSFSDGDELWFSFNLSGNDSGFENGIEFLSGGNQVLGVYNDASQTSPDRNLISVRDDLDVVTGTDQAVALSNSTSTAFTMIGRINFAAGDETLQLWYGSFVPSSTAGLGTNIPNVFSAPISIADIASIDQIRIDINNSGTGYVDEIRLAGSYADVISATSGGGGGGGGSIGYITVSPSGGTVTVSFSLTSTTDLGSPFTTVPDFTSVTETSSGVVEIQFNSAEPQLFLRLQEAP